MNKKRIIKNIFVVCSGIFVLCTAYDGLSMLQSTMNKEQNIGMISQAVLYGCFCLSALVLPKYVINKLGSKLTYVISMLTYIPCIAANYYPHWEVMIPASILVGLGAPLLWGSQATYLNDISTMYAELSYSKKLSSKQILVKKPIQTLQLPVSTVNPYQSHSNIHMAKVGDPNFCDMENKEKNRMISPDVSSVDNLVVVETTVSNKTTSDKIIPFKLKNSISFSKDDKLFQRYDIARRKAKIASITARVFGIHGMFYLSCQISGNFLSYFILNSGTVLNNNSSNSIHACGALYCNSHSNISNTNIAGVSDHTRYTLTSVFISLAIISVVIIAFFLDPLERKVEDDSSTLRLLLATFKMVKRPEVLLLVPLSFYIGYVQAFYTGEFTKAFVSCSWGTHHVPIVTVSCGFFCALSATSSGWLVKICGRRAVFTFAALLNTALNVILLLWSPNATHSEMYFIIAGIWGTYIGIIWSQLRAFYGLLFKADEDAAFAAFHLWYSLGFTVSFAYSGYFCTYVKIYVSLVVSILGYFGYMLVERMHSIKTTKK